ncbi:MAG: hypothetical protein Q7T97_00210 [Burkholderiaceae bacterium]|nr:hypothetical protein [Burkholderiaceae bacterium]
MSRQPHLRFATAALLALLVAWSGPARAAQAGEQWEYSGTMDMMGMKMPVPPTKVCTPVGADTTPPVDKNCRLSDVKTTPSKSSYRIVCGPTNAMEGTGEATRQGDTSRSVLRMKSSSGDMTVTTVGRKLGPCTPTTTN